MKVLKKVKIFKMISSKLAKAKMLNQLRNKQLQCKLLMK